MAPQKKIKGKKADDENKMSISGRIFVKGSVPKKGATVSIIDKKSNFLHTMLTNDKGEFSASELSPGKYMLRIKSDDQNAGTKKNVELGPSKESFSSDFHLTKPKLLKTWLGYGLWAIILGMVVISYFDLVSLLLKKELDIAVAMVENPEGKKVNAEGKVIYKGRIMKGKELESVWAMATDNHGNRHMLAAENDPDFKNGLFRIKIPPSLQATDANRRITRLKVFARARPPKKDYTMDGEQELFVGNRRIIAIPAIPMATLLFIFLVSIFIALKSVDMTKSYAKKYKYYSSIFLAFLFTCTMIVYISQGIRSVNQMVATNNNEIISLGFASVYKGKYSEETDPQWLFSLTFPTDLEKQMGIEYGEAPSASSTSSESSAGSTPEDPNASPETTTAPAPQDESVKKLARGFGAPLWVIFLAVVGAGIFTIHIIVQGIRESINDMDHERLRSRVQQIVVHEFYILFAPLGAIIVYQLLVIAGMAKQYLTVALAVLGAGLALNVILDRALQNVQDIVGGRSDRATIDPKVIQKALENKGVLTNDDFKQAKNETKSAA